MGKDLFQKWTTQILHLVMSECPSCGSLAQGSEPPDQDQLDLPPEQAAAILNGLEQPDE